MSDSTKDESTKSDSVQSKGKATPSRAQANAPETPGFFGRIALFIRQVIQELKKVVYPTRRELITYTTVVLVFVVVVMAFVGVLDLLFGMGATWLFTGKTS